MNKLICKKLQKEIDKINKKLIDYISNNLVTTLSVNPNYDERTEFENMVVHYKDLRRLCRIIEKKMSYDETLKSIDDIIEMTLEKEDYKQAHIYNKWIIRLIVTLQWLPKFLNNKDYGYMRFKKLSSGYVPFNFDDELIDIVNEEEFVSIEKDRLPLFIGTQFGIFPKINNMPNFFNGKKQIAILAKSVLSGHVSGLTIYSLNEEDRNFASLKNRKVIKFENDSN